jgi:hypothetical protein
LSAPDAVALTIPKSVPIPLTAPVPRSGLGGFARVAGCGTNLAGAYLRLAAQAAQLAVTIVTRVRRHRPPPVRALRFEPRQHRGNVAAESLTLFALGRRGSCKAAQGTEHRNSEEHPDHVLTFIAERNAKGHPKADDFAASDKARHEYIPSSPQDDAVHLCVCVLARY